MRCNRAHRVAFVSLLLSACATAPEMRGPQTAARLEVRIGDGRPTQQIVPGRAVPLRVYAFDEEGHVYHTANGSLGWGRLSVTGEGVLYDPVKHVVRAAPAARRALASTRYRVSVKMGDAAGELELRPDADAVIGPHPDSIERVQVAIDGQAQPRFLLPGRWAPLEITVTQRGGRRWRLARGLPAERIAVEPQHMGWDSDRVALLPSTDKAAIGEDLYRVKISYRALEGEVVERGPEAVEVTSIPDFQMLEGIPPEEVRGLQMKIGSGAEIVRPGERVPVEITIQDRHGRWLPVRSSRRAVGVPAELITVRARNGRFDPESQTLQLEPASRSLVGQGYQIAARYQGYEAQARRRLRPDFGAALAPLFTRATALSFKGSAGAAGRGGQAGAEGRRGHSASAKYGAGGLAGRGGDGTDGQPGANGAPGPEVKIVATLGTRIDGGAEVMLAVVEVGEARHTILTPIGGRPIRIASIGGRGGEGGRGGHGGRGGQGGDGYSTGDGGDGGHGGDGGRGGWGGPGGAVHLILSDERLRSMFRVDVSGGAGGPGGAPGHRGPGGRAGELQAVQIASALVDSITQQQRGGHGELPPQVSGSSGEYGRAGEEGPYGKAGPKGSVHVQIQPQARAIAQAASEEIHRLVDFK